MSCENNNSYILFVIQNIIGSLTLITVVEIKKNIFMSMILCNDEIRILF